MNNFFALRGDPLQLPLPVGCSPALQSDKPILKYCWLMKIEGGNKVWRCKLCNKEFKGSNIVVATHFLPKMSSQSLAKCGAISQFPPALTEQLNTAWSNKCLENEITAKKVKTVDISATTENRPASISTLLSAQARPLANAAILQFLVVKGVSVQVVNSPEFRSMVTAIRDAGPYYVPPNSHAFGKHTVRSDNELGLGHVLYSEFTRLKLVKETLLSGVSCIGGTLCSDGAKWRKRNCLNSVLQTSIGAFFCQSTGK
jgi:hypothetical protein